MKVQMKRMLMAAVMVLGLMANANAYATTDSTRARNAELTRQFDLYDNSVKDVRKLAVKLLNDAATNAEAGASALESSIRSASDWKAPIEVPEGSRNGGVCATPMKIQLPTSLLGPHLQEIGNKVAALQHKGAKNSRAQMDQITEEDLKQLEKEREEEFQKSLAGRDDDEDTRLVTKAMVAKRRRDFLQEVSAIAALGAKDVSEESIKAAKDNFAGVVDGAVNQSRGLLYQLEDQMRQVCKGKENDAQQSYAKITQAWAAANKTKRAARDYFAMVVGQFSPDNLPYVLNSSKGSDSMVSSSQPIVTAGLRAVSDDCRKATAEAKAAADKVGQALAQAQAYLHGPNPTTSAELANLMNGAIRALNSVQDTFNQSAQSAVNYCVKAAIDSEKLEDEATQLAKKAESKAQKFEDDKSGMTQAMAMMPQSTPVAPSSVRGAKSPNRSTGNAMALGNPSSAFSSHSAPTL